jgi:hypothetical protein
MQLKDFKKLVAYCRSAGILSYKGEVEFTLSPNDPKEERSVARKYRKVEEKVEQALEKLSDEDLLLYSSQGISGDV